MTHDQRVQKALGIRFDSDAGDSLTLREYFCELLHTIWDEGEGFSGKRPFGNSGWQFDVQRAIALGLADRDPSEDDGEESIDISDANDEFIGECITACFKERA